MPRQHGEKMPHDYQPFFVINHVKSSANNKLEKKLGLAHLKKSVTCRMYFIKVMGYEPGTSIVGSECFTNKTLPLCFTFNFEILFIRFVLLVTQFELLTS